MNMDSDSNLSVQSAVWPRREFLKCAGLGAGLLAFQPWMDGFARATRTPDVCGSGVFET